MNIAVFLHGTLIMHKNAVGKSREEIIQQIIDKDVSVKDYFSYIPVKESVKKLNKWVAQGAKLCYLSALKENENIKADKTVLKRYAFPEGRIYHRNSGESYQEVVERMSPLPDILIEDDCQSIGGEVEMTYPNLMPELKAKIKSIVVKEFSGIDDLPDKLEDLI